MSGAWLTIGRVVAADASRRTVRVCPAPGLEYEFEKRQRLWLDTGCRPVPVRVAMMRDTGQARLLITLTPGISRDAVARLKGASVVIPIEARNAIPESAPLLRSLVGLRVETTDRCLVGVVTETMETAGGGVMRIRCTNDLFGALPVTPALIRLVDVDSGVVVINDPAPFLVIENEPGAD